MPEFLTVKEAAAIVGKSPSSIRRILYPILENDGHADRDQIWPGVEEARALRVKGESFPWKLTAELLHREVPPETASAKEEPANRSSTAGAEGELLAMLRGELSIKNQQITEMAELMKGLSERLREGNILMGTLQKQLALGDGRERERKDEASSRP